MVLRDDLRADGDRELGDALLADIDIRRVLERLERDGPDTGARRQLLGSSMRLTAEMAPDVAEVIDGCRAKLELEPPVETFVYPGPFFNAAAVRPERGRLFLLLSSSLLEAFGPDELRFVVGHELGHHLFEHHRIPVAVLLGGSMRIGPELALRLFAWQRFAEISSDRAGVYCAGALDPAASALFKLASGLRGDRVRVRVDQFLAQVGDLRTEAARAAKADESPRSDWFATHPFSPLRLQAAQLFAGCELMSPGGIARARLEAEVQDLMLLMQPSYLREHSDVAETMRRVLLAGGVAVAVATGDLEEKAIAALEKLLGPGSLPAELKPEVLRDALPRRLDDMRATVPLLRRAQVIRDLCVIARADGRLDDAEVRVIRDIAQSVAVDESMVERTLRAGLGCPGGEGATGAA